MVGLTSCTAVQWVDAQGELHLAGLGRIESVRTDGGTVTRVVTPGMALRVVPSGYRYSVGWTETTLFQSTPVDRPREVVAIGDRTYGVAIDPASFMLGAEHRFFVLEPGDGKSVIQEIRYQSGPPSASWLRHQEGK